VLIIESDRADYFEKVAKGRDAKLAANWVTNELLAKLSRPRPSRMLAAAVVGHRAKWSS
jgi:Asp-tRNA(Asn)/Glu-tRNA(Gln) amidotransferase B subunit